jgi:hypothetical protein
LLGEIFGLNDVLHGAISPVTIHRPLGCRSRHIIANIQPRVGIASRISFTFLNPSSPQSNLMVMEPGGYRMPILAKFETPLVAKCLATVIAVTPVATEPPCAGRRASTP